VSHPLDTVKVHVQNKRPMPKSIRALYRGIAVPFVRNGIEHSSHFFFRGVVASAIHSTGMPGADNAWLVRKPAHDSVRVYSLYRAMRRIRDPTSA
jgi:hypothetical protein